MNRAANHARLAPAPALDQDIDDDVELPDADPERPLRILLADDDPRMRRLLALVLRRDGHDVVEVEDGAAVLEEMASVLLDSRLPAFDLVVSEHRMPGIPGLSLLAGMRARDPLTPFILIADDPAVQAEARQLGASILDRPFNLEAIRRAVRVSGAR